MGTHELMVTVVSIGSAAEKPTVIGRPVVWNRHVSTATSRHFYRCGKLIVDAVYLSVL